MLIESLPIIVPRADLCMRLPPYLFKVPALFTINLFLTTINLRLTIRYVLKVIHSFDELAIKKCANRIILKHGINWHKLDKLHDK